MDSLYTFPLIAQDLRREEYVIQIADSLEYLTNIVDDIFSRINRRIDENASKTKNIVDRISVCKQKVDKLTDSNKATNVYSAAKYPAMDCFKHYNTVFAHDNELVLKRTEDEITSRMAKPIDNQIQEKLEFYHVKSSSTNLYQWLLDNQPHSGLGEIPHGIENISSLLIFNSKQYAYGMECIKKNKRLQNSKAAGPAIPERKHDLSNIIEAAPYSISNRDQAPKKATDSYLYSPGTGEAPAMDMPLDLPHLSGVAEDLYLTLDTEPKIAPLILPPNEPNEVIVPSTPILDTPAAKIETKDVPDEVETVTKSTVPAPAPPPPPPPPAPMMMDQDISASKPSDAAKLNNPLPVSAPKSAAPVDRSSLMEAIRNAGGTGKAKLRSLKVVKDEELKSPPSSSNSGGSDLMADLHAKLSMRRKGISGAQPKADGSILSVISAMIPPPAQKQADQLSTTEVSSTDDDWE